MTTITTSLPTVTRLPKLLPVRDFLTPEQCEECLVHIPDVRELLWDGTYRPQPFYSEYICLTMEDFVVKKTSRAFSKWIELSLQADCGEDVGSFRGWVCEAFRPEAFRPGVPTREIQQARYLWLDVIEVTLEHGTLA